MNDITNLFKTFDKYKYNTTEELEKHIEPSINLNQYKVFEDKNGIYGFVNWAYLNKEVGDGYKLTAKINMHNWNCGTDLWVHDIVASRKGKEVMLWIYRYTMSVLKLNDKVQWLRLNKDNNIYRVSSKYKREFHI